MTLSPTLIWFVVGLALVLFELIAPGVFLIFFGAGAWLTAIATSLGLTPSLASQLLVFSISSVILLLLLRRWLRNRFLSHVSGERDPTTNLDEFTGKRVLVVRDIEPDGAGGRVEYKGAEWDATADTRITKGRRVEITAVDGIILKVKSLETEE